MRTTLIIAAGALVMVGPSFAATTGGGGGGSSASTSSSIGPSSSGSGSTGSGSAVSGSGSGRSSSGGGGGGHIGSFVGGAHGGGGYGVRYVAGGHMGTGDGMVAHATLAAGPASHSAALAIRVVGHHGMNPNPRPHPHVRAGRYFHEYTTVCTVSLSNLCSTTNLYCDGSELYDFNPGTDPNLINCPHALKSQSQDEDSGGQEISLAMTN